MGYKQAFEMLDLMELEKEIGWHFQYNLDPPAPCEMIPVALKAVILGREHKFNENLLIPFKDGSGWMVPAHIIIDIYHLEPWCS